MYVLRAARMTSVICQPNVQEWTTLQKTLYLKNEIYSIVLSRCGCPWLCHTRHDKKFLIINNFSVTGQPLQLYHKIRRIDLNICHT